MERSEIGPRDASLPLAATAEDRDVITNPYLSAQRWRSYLLEHSVAFRRLQAEREQGWKSAALDKWYAKRNSNTSTSSTNAATTNAGHPASPLIEKYEGLQGNGTTVFVKANVRILSERYRQHARQITKQAASSFLTVASKSCTPESNNPDTHAAFSAPLFLDLGCAPGGMSKYLVKDLGWRGVGVTLATEDGGIGMDPELLQECTGNNASFVLLEGDVTQPPSTWKPSPSPDPGEDETCATDPQKFSVPATTSTESKTGVLSCLPSLFQSNSAAAKRIFHFVNAGAVLDHGQRQRWDNLHEAATAAPNNGVMFGVGRGKEADCDRNQISDCPHATCAQVAEPILPWFSLLVPQLKTALTYVATGGALMLVHGAPHCASLFILMRCMEEVLGQDPAAPSSVALRHAHVLETMHLAKAPMYVLWTGVRLTGNEPNAGHDPPMEDPQTCLLEALSVTSARISPLPGTASSSPSMTFADGRQALLYEKQRLWLGESDEGFALAVSGFQRYGHLVEAVWERAEAFLRQRREVAERQVGRVDDEARRCRGLHTSKDVKRARNDC